MVKLQTENKNYVKNSGKKIPVIDWLSMMGRTKHLVKPECSQVVERMQQEIDHRYSALKKKCNMTTI